MTKVGYLYAQLAHLISLNYPIFYAHSCYTPVKFLNKAQPLHHYGMLVYFLHHSILVQSNNGSTDNSKFYIEAYRKSSAELPKIYLIDDCTKTLFKIQRVVFVFGLPDYSLKISNQLHWWEYIFLHQHLNHFFKISSYLLMIKHKQNKYIVGRIYDNQFTHFNINVTMFIPYFQQPDRL